MVVTTHAKGAWLRCAGGSRVWVETAIAVEGKFLLRVEGLTLVKPSRTVVIDGVVWLIP